MSVSFRSVLPQVMALARSELELSTGALAEGAAANMRARMELPHHGRVYRSRRRDGTEHVASAPGEAPAIDTGEYADSIEVVYAGKAEYSLWSGEIGTYLEDGTARIEPRPHIQPAFDAAASAAELALVTVRAELEKIHV